ncbi:MAG: hypothetical protein IKX94_02580, partial [Muribaculaceae bacterium]|nr:hypothetical protein [Muribaculaceae bacterium]
DAEQYVGKRFNNVRGLYCAERGRERGNYFGWLNPNMEVASTPVILESGVETRRNTYSVANFSEQDDCDFFFLEPRPCEICNVVDAMRTGNDVILAPTRNAITPDGNEDYVDDNIEGGTAFFNGFGIGTPPYGPYGTTYDADGNKIYAYVDVDKEYCENSWDVPTQFAWRSYFKLFNFTDVIAICFDHDQINDAFHDYPLDIPNPHYEQDQLHVLFGLMGTGNTHSELGGDYDEDFYVGISDYYSRYDWRRDVNVYKNDMHINFIEHPHEGYEHLDVYGDIDLIRCDYAGHPIARVATLEFISTGRYRLNYNSESQTAVNNGVLDEMLFENGQVLGHPVVNNHEYDVTAPDSEEETEIPAISFSDCFISEQMLTQSSVEEMNTDYTYRLYAHNNGDEIHAILGHVPVYVTPHNEVWRARLTKDEVDADTEGALALNNGLNIKFSSNTNRHVLKYHLLEGHGTEDEEEIAQIIATHPHMEGGSHAIIDNGDGYEHYEQNGDNGAINWDGLWVVPTIESEINNNTYGCYKETVNSADVSIARDCSRPNYKLGISKLELTGENDARYRYFHCSIHISSNQEINENANSEERYLYRLWREVKPNNNANFAPRRNSEEQTSNRVLLNTTPEFGSTFDPNDYWSYWATNYTELQEFTGEEINVSDTFLHEVPADSEEYNSFVLDVEYQAVLYVHDTVEDLYYPVASEIIPITWDLGSESVITSVNTIDADNRTVAGVEYYNAYGQLLTSPNGLTIVVTRFSDGSVVSTKQIFK